MKCLTFSECVDWLAPNGVTIGQNRHLVFPSEREKIMSTLPERALAIDYFAIQLMEWFAPATSRLIWVSNWETNPSNQIAIFEKLRLGCRQTRSLLEAPGHLFETATVDDNDIFVGLLFLIMAFNWECYVVNAGGKECLYLGDEYIVFSSSNTDDLKRASRLMTHFKSKPIHDVKEAWQ